MHSIPNMTSFFIDDERTVGLLVEKLSNSFVGDMVGNSVSHRIQQQHYKTCDSGSEVRLDHSLTVSCWFERTCRLRRHLRRRTVGGSLRLKRRNTAG